jgi:hypothetical protein
MANPDAKPHEEHITRPTTIVANIVNILFVSIPPAINVFKAEKEIVIKVSFTEVKIEGQIKTLDLII